MRERTRLLLRPLPHCLPRGCLALLLGLSLSGGAVAARANLDILSDPDKLFAEFPAWGLAARNYQPPVDVVTKLNEWQGVRLDIYYGAWCRDSAREVPKLLRLAGIIGAEANLVPVDMRKRITEPHLGQWELRARKTPTIEVWAEGRRQGSLVESLRPEPATALLHLLETRREERRLAAQRAGQEAEARRAKEDAKAVKRAAKEAAREEKRAAREAAKEEKRRRRQQKEQQSE